MVYLPEISDDLRALIDQSTLYPLVNFFDVLRLDILKHGISFKVKRITSFCDQNRILSHLFFQVVRGRHEFTDLLLTNFIIKVTEFRQRIWVIDELTHVFYALLVINITEIFTWQVVDSARVEVLLVKLQNLISIFVAMIFLLGILDIFRISFHIDFSHGAENISLIFVPMLSCHFNI